MKFRLKTTNQFEVLIPTSSKVSLFQLYFSMRKSLIISILLAGASLTSYADNTLQMVFQTADGSTKSIDANALSITIDNGNLIANNGGSSLQFALTNLTKMYFTNGSSGIDLPVAGLNNGPVKIYSLSGVYEGEFESVADASNALTPGTYVIKTNDDKTLKIIVK